MTINLDVCKESWRNRRIRLKQAFADGSYTLEWMGQALDITKQAYHKLELNGSDSISRATDIDNLLKIGEGKLKSRQQGD